MVLPCIEVKRFEKTCFPACDYCNVGCNDRPTQFSGSEVGSGNCKNSICALSYAPLRFGLLLYFRRFVQCTKMWKHFNAITEVFYCFTVAIGLPGEASGCNEDERSSAAARMQNKVVFEWGNCAELGVRFWPFRPHWNSCEHAQLGGGHEGCVPHFFRQWRYNMPCSPTFFSLGFNIGFTPSCSPHILQQNRAHGADLCITKLSDAVAKSELKADWERRVNYRNLERWMA